MQGPDANFANGEEEKQFFRIASLNGLLSAKRGQTLLFFALFPTHFSFQGKCYVTDAVAFETVSTVIQYQSETST